TDLEHARGAQVELVEPAEPHRRVEGHRNRSGQQGAEEGVHESRPGGENERDAVAPADPERSDRGGSAAGARAEVAEGQAGLVFAAVEEGEARGAGEGRGRGRV